MSNDEIFSGQLTCIVCDRQEVPQPHQHSNWRCIEVEGQKYYACPDEFPADTAGKDKFKTAYQLVVACCINDLNRQKSGVVTLNEIELYRAKRRIQQQRKPRGFGR